MATKLLRKATIGSVVGDRRELLRIAETGKDGDGKGKPINVMMVLGSVDRIKAGVVAENSSEYVKLFGNFEVTNMVTGEIIPDIGECILPNFVSTAIAAAIKAGADNVQFGVTIQIRYSPLAITFYEFEAESLMAPQTAAPIAALKAQLAAQGIALPAPTKQAALAAPAATPEPTPAPSPAPTTKKGK